MNHAPVAVNDPLAHHHVGAVAGNPIRVRSQPVASRKVHDHLAVADHDHPVAGDIGLDDLRPSDGEVQAEVFLAPPALAVVHSIELRGDSDLRTGLQVVLGPPVHPGAAVVIG